MVLLSTIKVIAIGLLSFVGVAFLLGPGIQMQPENFRLKDAPEFLGPLSPNRLLDSSEKLFEGIIGNGPESIIIKNNVLYTGVDDGRIQQISGPQAKLLTHIGGPNCETTSEENDGCGRPLGLRLNKQGELVVADAYRGLYTVSLDDGKVTTLVSSSAKIDGKRLTFADDLAIASNGDIFFSDASSKWTYKEYMLDLIESAGNGRILHYDSQTKNVTVLIKNAYFPNGVELSADEDYLLFAQTARCNILKYYLKGEKKGQTEYFHENLPGGPDNIRRSPRGTYWVAIAGVHLPHEEYINERLSEYPTLRRIVASTLYFTIQLLQKLTAQFQLPLVDILQEKLSWNFANFFYNTDYGLILELDSDGKILRSLHSPNGVINKISQVTEHDNVLYIASYHNDFFAKFAL